MDMIFVYAYGILFLVSLYLVYWLEEFLQIEEILVAAILHLPLVYIRDLA